MLHKVELTRNGVSSELYVGSDDVINIINSDNNGISEYYIVKQRLLKDLVDWMRKFNVTKYECEFEE